MDTDGDGDDDNVNSNDGDKGDYLSVLKHCPLFPFWVKRTQLWPTMHIGPETVKYPYSFWKVQLYFPYFDAWNKFLLA